MYVNYPALKGRACERLSVTNSRPGGDQLQQRFRATRTDGCFPGPSLFRARRTRCALRST